MGEAEIREILAPSDFTPCAVLRILATPKRGIPREKPTFEFLCTARCYGAGDKDMATSSLHVTDWSAAMPQPNDLSRSLVALDQNSTIIAVVEMSQSSWLVGGVVPGIERQPRKKLEPSPERLLGLAASLAG